MELVAKRVERRPNLSSQVYDAVRDDIMTGALRGGDRLIVEKLANQFGISPTPVREALARLMQEGIVKEAGPGRLRIVPLTERYVLDTYWVRGALEGLAAELAASRLQPHESDSLQHLSDVATAALAGGDVAAYAAADREIHRVILVAAANSVLTRDLAALQSHIGYIRDYSHRHAGEHLTRANVEHAPILEALSARDATTARALMELHIRRSAERIARLVAEVQPALDANHPQ